MPLPVSLQRPNGRRAVAIAAIVVLLALALAIVLLTRQAERPAGGKSAWAVAERSREALERLPGRPEDLAAQQLERVGPEAARRLNAATPFADLNPPAAAPFRFAGSEQDRARARDCLALAALAEAGGDDDGQRAVIQVILNRTRHPAFTPTVCGVVFQGSLRKTGCQFTFTCDGALARRYGEGAWQAARLRADAALAGKVYAPVGTATHYHTDWVHPVWSAELDKIARVQTHLFFRWKGYWGRREAARATYRGNEPAIAQIAWLPAHAPAEIAAAAADGAPGEAPATGLRVGERIKGGVIAGRNPLGQIYLVQLTGASSRPAIVALGRDICGGKGYCRVWGWADVGAAPSSLPIAREARARLSFSYTLDTSNTEYVFYDCRRFEDAPRDACLPRS